MKKIKSLSFILCFAIAFTALLTSCAHQCEFATDWSKDATAHWHACTKADCVEIADKAEHTWNEGEITTEATQEADGVKTFTCTVCAQTKTEAVAFTGMTNTEWKSAFYDSVFENFTYTEVITTETTGISMNAESVYKFTEDAAWAKMTVGSETEESYAPDTASANEVRKQLVDSIKDIASYSKYEYDPATKTYKATEEIEITSLGASTDDVTLKFADGKLVEIKYTVSFTQGGIAFSATSTITLSDYGTVVLNPS